MALIKCPECGKEISDKSKICIGCGFPIHEFFEEEKKEKNLLLEYKCPNCGYQNEIGEDYCENCDIRITPYSKSKKSINNSTEPYSICPVCSEKNDIGVFTCTNCGHKYTCKEYDVIFPDDEMEEFDGVYRPTIFNGLQRVYCPRCRSSNCSHYKEQKIIPGKTKTRYNINLNPLHPFTLVNKKEKVVRKDQLITENKFICNDCGKIFS